MKSEEHKLAKVQVQRTEVLYLLRHKAERNHRRILYNLTKNKRFEMAKKKTKVTANAQNSRIFLPTTHERPKAR